MEQERSHQRHATLYFEDGDLELSARNAEPGDGGCQLFRVYRTQLGRLSPVFRDMLALGGDRREVVEMPDSAEDLAALLESIFIPSSLVHRLWATRPRQSAIELSGLARIARKYEVEDVVEVVVQHVANLWPQSLAEWDKTYPAWMANTGNPTTSDLVPEPASAIRFAKEFDVSSILPAAFYFFAVQTAESITVVKESSLRAVVRWDLTDHATLFQLMQGKERMQSKFLRHFKSGVCSGFSAYQDFVPHAGRERCITIKDEVQLKAIGGEFGGLNQGQWDYLETLRLVSLKMSASKHVCPECKEGTKENAATARSELWEGLLGFFAISEGL